MTRTIKEDEYATKRDKILDGAQRLVFTKGYERMSIQDILDALGISKGAFYHYFDSKAALLEAYVERGQDALDQEFRAIVEAPGVPAVEKFRQFYAAVDRARASQQTFVADLMWVWFADDNAIVREKLDAVIVQRRAPWLNAIVRQGVAEGVFSTPYPDQAGAIILAITRGMGNAVLKLILAGEQAPEQQRYVEEIVAVSAAAAEAIERVLGASDHIVARADAAAVQGWLTALSRATAQPA